MKDLKIGETKVVAALDKNWLKRIIMPALVFLVPIGCGSRNSDMPPPQQKKAVQQAEKVINKKASSFGMRCLIEQKQDAQYWTFVAKGEDDFADSFTVKYNTDYTKPVIVKSADSPDFGKLQKWLIENLKTEGVDKTLETIPCPMKDYTQEEPEPEPEPTQTPTPEPEDDVEPTPTPTPTVKPPSGCGFFRNCTSPRPNYPPNYPYNSRGSLRIGQTIVVTPK